MYLQSFLVFSDLSTYYHVQFQNIIITSKRNPFPIHKPLSIPSFPCPLDCHLIYCVFMNFPILDIYMCFTQPCPSLCSPKDCTPPGSSVCGIFQSRKAPLSLEFSWQVYWSGLPFPTLGNLPYPGIETVSLASLALVDGSLPLAPPGKTFM